MFSAELYGKATVSIRETASITVIILSLIFDDFVVIRLILRFVNTKLSAPIPLPGFVA